VVLRLRSLELGSKQAGPHTNPGVYTIVFEGRRVRASTLNSDRARELRLDAGSLLFLVARSAPEGHRELDSYACHVERRSFGRGARFRRFGARGLRNRIEGAKDSFCVLMRVKRRLAELSWVVQWVGAMNFR